MKLSDELENHRITKGPYGTKTYSPCGAFIIPYKSFTIKVISYDGFEDKWEHVSVSLKHRTSHS